MYFDIFQKFNRKLISRRDSGRIEYLTATDFDKIEAGRVPSWAINLCAGVDLKPKTNPTFCPKPTVNI